MSLGDPYGMAMQNREYEEHARAMAERTRERALERARELQNHYENTLEDVFCLKVNPTPNFTIKNPYRYETLTREEKAAYKQKILEARVAISESDSEKLKITLLPSFIPALTRYTHETHQRRWKWAVESRKLIFGRQAEYLLNWYLQKFFYDKQVINMSGLLIMFGKKKDKHKHIKKMQAMTDCVQIYKQIINDSTGIDGILHIDNFVESMQPITGHQEFRTLYNYLDRARLYSIAIHKPGKLSETELYGKEDLQNDRLSYFCKLPGCRVLDAKHHYELREIFRTQLVIPTKTAELHAKLLQQFALEDIALNSFSILATNLSFTFSYPLLLIQIYQDSLQKTDDLHAEFMSWFDENIKLGMDIAEASQKCQKKVSEILSSCQDLINEQKYAMKQLGDNANNRNAMSIAHISLMESNKLIPNEPLLHAAMRQYACAKGEMKSKAFACVYTLIERGCSPYVKNSDSLNALEYAARNASDETWQEWELFECILQHTITYSPFSEMVRQELLAYCETCITEMKSYVWYYYYYQDINKEQMMRIGKLVESLDEANKIFCDSALLISAKSLIAEIPAGSKLFILLDKVIKSQDECLVFLRHIKYNNNADNKRCDSSIITAAGITFFSNRVPNAIPASMHSDSSRNYPYGLI